ncbi:MAG: hypothetical protein ACE5EX_11055 [Phycisphaerae bacterium]
MWMKPQPTDAFEGVNLLSLDWAMLGRLIDLMAAEAVARHLAAEADGRATRDRRINPLTASDEGST